MDWLAKTTAAYDASPELWATYFEGIGARVDDIERALRLASRTDGTARVVEIGCGDGRDAQEIVMRAGWYEGFDPSKGLLRLAKQKLPQANFVEAHALSYEYPPNLDVVFAFASLLHVDRSDLRLVLERVSAALRPGGVFYISLKESPAYKEAVSTDERGHTRMFYYYNAGIVKDLAGNLLEPAYISEHKIGHTDWFDIALQKPQ